MDNRAQGSIGIARLFLSLGVGAFVIWMVSTFADNLLPGARSAGSSQYATQGTDWLASGVVLIPIFIVLIVLFGTIVLAVYQRELVR